MGGSWSCSSAVDVSGIGTAHHAAGCSPEGLSPLVGGGSGDWCLGWMDPQFGFVVGSQFRPAAGGCRHGVEHHGAVARRRVCRWSAHPWLQASAGGDDAGDGGFT